MAENNMNDGTSFHQSDKPILCANGCGFFGTANTMNLCSKCYRDQHLKEERESVAKAAVEKSMSSSIPSPSKPPVKLVVENKKPPLTAVEESPVVVEESPAVVEESPVVVEKPKNRCGSCNKKVGVMGFKCRCGATFCGSHRYPEEHECTFDFKGAGKEAITKANPIVKADKLERF